MSAPTTTFNLFDLLYRIQIVTSQNVNQKSDINTIYHIKNGHQNFYLLIKMYCMSL